MKDLGLMHYFLGLEFWQQKGDILLGQGRYATEILKRFRMEDCRPMATPMITSWKKIDALEDKDVDPTLYRQLIGSLMYLVNTRPDNCYAVNTLNWAGSSVDWKNTFGYCFNIGSGMTSWCSRKQKFVALSSSEVEYMAASTTSCDAIWIRKLLVNLFRRKMEATMIIDCVQRGVVQLSYTPTGEQVVDILTKALGRTKFDYFREKMGMIKNLFQ
eukprot:PITA_08574